MKFVVLSLVFVSALVQAAPAMSPSALHAIQPQGGSRALDLPVSPTVDERLKAWMKAGAPNDKKITLFFNFSVAPGKKAADVGLTLGQILTTFPGVDLASVEIHGRTVKLQVAKKDVQPLLDQQYPMGVEIHAEATELGNIQTTRDQLDDLRKEFSPNRPITRNQLEAAYKRAKRIIDEDFDLSQDLTPEKRIALAATIVSPRTLFTQGLSAEPLINQARKGFPEVGTKAGQWEGLKRSSQTELRVDPRASVVPAFNQAWPTANVRDLEYLMLQRDADAMEYLKAHSAIRHYDTGTVARMPEGWTYERVPGSPDYDPRYTLKQVQEEAAKK